jgi:hypothetical protein
MKELHNVAEDIFAFSVMIIMTDKDSIMVKMQPVSSRGNLMEPSLTMPMKEEEARRLGRTLIQSADVLRMSRGLTIKEFEL